MLVVRSVETPQTSQKIFFRLLAAALRIYRIICLLMKRQNDKLKKYYFYTNYLRITPFLFSKVFSISKKSKKKIFLTPLGKSKNFKNFKIFNNIGSHDVLKKKITKIGQNAANPSFFLFTLYINPVA